MSREEANKLSSQRREELRNYAKLMETSSLARFKAAFPVSVFNICYYLMCFYN